MTDMKSLWQSKTFWAGAFGFFASLGGIVGLKIDPAQTAQLAELVPLVVANVTSAASIVFRILADTKINSKL
ncbi:MAG: hypothetical protein ACRCXM_07235 [Beijerinckiaceae bacterium]